MTAKQAYNPEPGKEMGSLKELFKKSAKKLLKKSRSKDPSIKKEL